MRNPLSIEAFASWCEKQPAEKAYNWGRCSECAAGQYAAFLGVDDWTDQLPWGPGRFWYDASFHALRARPHTFGALASRLRASLKEQGR